MSEARYRKVPSARLTRLASFGKLAGGIAGGVIAEGARKLASGDHPRLSDLLLTPANARRVTDELSRMRGAAMKLGQMISLDAGDFLPAESTAVLARLRDSAHFMPPSQLNRVLISEWGTNWRRKFKHFEPTPIAAASIGQVHRATLPNGKVLAVKVQYPGIARSINADVDNVASLLRLSNLLPERIDLTPLLTEAKRQLHEEADYRREAEQMRRYRAMLSDEPAFIVPEPVEDLSTERILAMEFVEGQPIEALQGMSQQTRDAAMVSLLGLVLRELFEFGYMQTDPNFANYRWHAQSGRIVLLDFGATRTIPHETIEAYRRLMRAGLAEDRRALRDTLVETGFISPVVLNRHRTELDSLIEVLMTHLGRPGLFDFSDRSFVDEVRQRSQTIVSDRAAWHIPPADTLFVQRKISGTAMLAIRMQAKLPLREMVMRHVPGRAVE